MLVFAIKYRHRPGHEGGESPGHSTALELTWTIVPTIIVLVIFYYGFRGYLDMTVVPPNAYEITVDSKMWNWGFVYPNGHVNPELHIPQNRPVRLILTSQDVIHSLYIPAFRSQKQAVPGRYNRFWFQATEAGVYFRSTAPSTAAPDHSEMLTKVVVHEPADFDAWLEVASNPEKQPDFTPLKAGAADRSAPRVHAVPLARRLSRHRADVQGPLRQAGSSCRRHRAGGRELHPRVDPLPEQADRQRLPGGDAVVPRQPEGQGDRLDHRLPEVEQHALQGDGADRRAAARRRRRDRRQPAMPATKPAPHPHNESQPN